MENKRLCIYCNKPMYTSNYSIWINEKNYDIHAKCEKEVMRDGLKWQKLKEKVK